ncbi:hypothetical protein CLV84_3223 [Neolewinella xylanilytica]|uniref:Arginase n=2 Tax=Neolewinella xylanilytica TaxID=1514080 RepID=A0A2S6I579_9BACT|nr:hypothetical protein CLV84_3223 [Neolewinella xylanilytica]
MYAPWLQSDYLPQPGHAPESFGYHLLQTAKSEAKVAIIGMHPAWADQVRDCLYGHFWDHGDLQVADLGNLRKPSVDFAIPLLKELYVSGILPVLIGASPLLAEAQYLAFAEVNREVGICSIDSKLRLSYEAAAEGDRRFLDRAVHRTNSPAFHLAHLGDQRHLSDPRLDLLFLSRHFERYPLGKSRSDLRDLEPAIRDVDLTVLNINAVLAAEAPSQSEIAPSGFSLQEAGQLAYYAGNSDRLASFGIYGAQPIGQNQPDRLTAAAYAQLIWYFLHGVSRRHADFPTTATGLVEYVVDSKVNDRFVFWRSPRSDRWWVQVPIDKATGEVRNRLVSCSYADYVAASSAGELPERLFHAFSRY